MWALPQVPFQTFAAEPVANARASLAQLHENLSANKNWQSQFMMPIHMTLTNYSIFLGTNVPVSERKQTVQNGLLTFSGVPFLSPFIRAEHDVDGDFLFGGFFPNMPRSTSLPPELFDRLNTPNLVYYHWEITSERLKELPQLSQLLLMVTNRRQLNGKSVAHGWLERFAPAITNMSSLTMAVETSPAELSFTRTAPAGLTAEELFALANWLEAPNFPAFDLKLPARPKLGPRSKMPMPLLSVPAPGQPPTKK